MVMRFSRAVLLALCGLLFGNVAGAAVTPQYDRIYLLSSDADYLYWSVDRFDPELGLSSTSRPCGLNYLVPGRAKPCLVGVNAAEGARTYNLFFLPGSALDEKVTWSAASPLKFHIEADVNTGGVPFTLQLVLQKTGTLVLSDPVTQTSPGVWEGQMTSGSPLNVGEVNLIGIRVTSQGPAALIDMRLAGRSYVELPRAFAAHSVPDMVREDSYSPEPTSYTTKTRSFTFNDAKWATQSFTGNTTATQTFDFSIGQKAEALLVWAELYDSTFVQDVKDLRQPDPRKLPQGISLSLSRGGEVIKTSGSCGTTCAGWGTRSLATMDLAAGPLSLAVIPQQSGDQSLPYTVHVLEVRGDRTLRTMRWLFMNGTSSRSPAAAVCPSSNEPVPATDKVKSVALDLDWNSEAVGNAAFTWRFDMPYGGYPCSEGGTGDEIRLTIPPAERVWHVGATPSYGSTYFSVHDTTFEATARYTYSAPAAA
jgi:hypothetical protein